MTRFGIGPLLEKVQAAVEAEGMRPFARRAGVGLGVVRSILDGRDPSFSNAAALAEALGLDFGFGPARPPVTLDPVPQSDYVSVPVHDAFLAAGDGFSNMSEVVVDELAFRRDWLKRINVSPLAARLARLQGDSMRPTLWHGDMILIDTKDRIHQVRQKNKRDQRRPPVYALIDHGEARVKRLDRPADDTLMLLSDNPDYPPELRQGHNIQNIQIIGKVVWWAHTVRE